MAFHLPAPPDSMYTVQPVVTKCFRSFNLLPTDVKCKIFSYLPFGVVKKAALCSKELNEYILPLIDFNFACMGCNHRLISFRQYVNTLCTDFLHDAAVCVKAEEESATKRKPHNHGFQFGETFFIPVPTYTSSDHEILQYSYLQKLLGFISDGEHSFSLCDVCCENCGMFLGLKICDIGIASKRGEVTQENPQLMLQREGGMDSRMQAPRFVLPGVNLNWFALTINEMLNVEHSEDNWDENFNATAHEFLQKFRPVKRGEALLCKQRLNVVDKGCNALILSDTMYCSHCNNSIAHGRALLDKRMIDSEGEGEDLLYLTGLTAGAYVEHEEAMQSSRFPSLLVKDVSCAVCHRRVGWKHLARPAQEEEILSLHRHLHGVFCLHRQHIIRSETTSIRSEATLGYSLLPAEFRSSRSL